MASSLEWATLVGRSVTVDAVGGVSVSGRVYACDLVSNVLVLERPSAAGPATGAGAGAGRAAAARSDFDVFKIQHITAVQLAVDVADPDTNTGSVSTPGHVNVQQLVTRERKNLADAARALDKVGVNVTPDAQACFNALDKTLPCRWVAETIVVLDGDVTVGPPYTADAAKGKSAVSLAHVRKILTQEEQRRAASGTVP